ncbi:MAG: STAS domain-containing protein [Bacteroidaceae bacterium]|jgi:anti-anti-sigma factor|nr:STAS domain-containing protein [Bacteroidaceae bacterium]
MKVTITQNANVVEATIEGRLDTVTSSEFEKQLAPFYLTPGIELILDCNAMEYISSAGLRVVLIAHKSITANGGRFVVSNLSKEVRSVFDMTGFSRILIIK